MALAKRIIPCLDCDKGRVVKGVKFVDIRDAGDPVEVSKRYCDAGADEITFLDITASHEDRNTTVDTCLLYTSPRPRDRTRSRMPSSA